jgi:hypothetical protein
MRQIVQTPQYGTKTARLPRSVAGEEFEMPPSMRQPLIQTFPKLVSIEGAIVRVRGLDCLDGTPLLDLKPDRALFTPIAPPQPGDFQVGES